MAGAEKEILYLQVKSIAEKIVLTGEKPNIDNIYELLGGVGDKKLVEEYLNRWQEEREKESTLPTEKISEITAKNFEQLIEERTRELKKSLSLVRATLESTEDGILMIDNRGRIVDWNQKFFDIVQAPKEVIEQGREFAGIKYVLTQVEKPWELIKLMLKLQFNRKIEGDVGEVRTKDGRVISRYSYPYRIDGKIQGRVWSFRDITAKRKAEEALRLRERAIESSTQGVIIMDDSPELNILYANPAFSRITEYPNHEVFGKSIDFLFGTELQQPEVQKIRHAEQKKHEERVVVRCYRKDGTMFWNEMYISPVPDAEGKITHFVGIVNDITERKAMEEQLLHQATHDFLTDLPNRLLLQDRIQQAIEYARRDEKLVLILFLDLDRFKLVNDSLGHKMGDELLRLVSKRLKGMLRPTDTVSRIGGDEFIMILTPVSHVEESIIVSQRILNKIREPYYIQERELHVTGSIGITYYPKDGSDSETLIRNADTAMYLAKDSGRDNFQFYTDELNRLVTQRLTMGSYLYTAVDHDELELLYQPIFELATGKVVSFEALLRWNSQELGLVSPLEFIPLAEEMGLILPIGEWVFKTACAKLKHWRERGATEIQMAVNVSSRQLQDKKFLESVQHIVTNNGFSTNHIVIEITESVFLGHSNESIDKLHQLRTMGFKLAIDDFGTGYSSLSYLKRLPVDKLKIDRAFVNEITSSASSKAISLAIITLCKSLKIRTVAEGVENREQIEVLQKFQCDEIQGYYFSKPISAEACEKLLAENLETFK